MIEIPKDEFRQRIEKLRQHMDGDNIGLCLVFGDEYRKENLRYVSNYWPIFERGMLVVPLNKEPVLLVAPEGEQVAREMSAWSDIRNVREFTCVTVPDEIEYQYAKYTSFSQIAKEFQFEKRRMGIIGLDIISRNLYGDLKSAFSGIEFVDYNQVIFGLRLIKSSAEVECLREAWRIADEGYRALVEKIQPGMRELEICAEAEYAARKAGAEDIPFFVFGSGNRTNTIVGRPVQKTIKDGEMIMAALAVQYEGYVSTVELPFVVGNADSRQKEIIDALIIAEDKALEKLRAGVEMREFVKTVKDHFRKENLGEYDIYPPLHGCGCAEAESPYPDEKCTSKFEVGMTVNTDISLFGTPAGSNRLEEGFVITEKGPEPFSKYVRAMCTNWLRSK